MIDATQTSSTAASAQAARTASAISATGTDTADGTEDRFLKLLVAQMRNQDPLNPLDNAQVTSQLAQINTVRGIEQLNSSMSKVAAASGAISPVSAVGLLGRQVLVAGDTFELGSASTTAAGDATSSTSSRSVRLGFDLAAAAKLVRIEIVDPLGRTVYTHEVQNAEAGVQTFDWNGLDADGNAVDAGKYRMRVNGSDYQGAELSPGALVPTRVSGVVQGADGARIELAGRQATSASAIRAIL